MACLTKVTMRSETFGAILEVYSLYLAPWGGGLFISGSFEGVLLERGGGGHN